MIIFLMKRNSAKAMNIDSKYNIWKYTKEVLWLDEKTIGASQIILSLRYAIIQAWWYAIHQAVLAWWK